MHKYQSLEAQLSKSEELRELALKNFIRTVPDLGVNPTASLLRDALTPDPLIRRAWFG
jgi:hypothetical protein